MDTQVLVMAYLGDPLPQRVQDFLADPETDRVLSAISVMEIATKSSLQMKREHISEAAMDLQLRMIPFTAKHAYHLFTLPMHHRDPFDRMLIATALAEDIAVDSADRQFKHVRVIWQRRATTAPHRIV